MLPLTAFFIFFMGAGTPPDLNALLTQSEALVKAGKSREALDLMTKAEALLTSETPVPQKRLVFYRLGYLYGKDGQFSESKTCLMKGFSLEATSDPADRAVLLKVSNLVVEELLREKVPEEAAKVWHQSADLFKEDLPETPSGFNHLLLGVQCLTKTGETSEAFDLADAAFHLMEKRSELAGKRMALYVVMSSLAEQFKKEENYEPVVTLYQSIFDFEKKQLNPMDPALLPLCFKLADAYWWNSKSPYTYHYYELASKIAEKAGDQKLALGKAYFGMAEVIASWNNNDEAVPLYQKALVLMSELLPKDSPDLKALRDAIKRNQEILKERK